MVVSKEAVLSVVDGKVATLSVAVIKVAVLEDGSGKVADFLVAVVKVEVLVVVDVKVAVLKGVVVKVASHLEEVETRERRPSQAHPISWTASRRMRRSSVAAVARRVALV